MIWFANLIFYNLYRFEVRVQELINYPFLYVLRKDKVRQAYKKRGVNDPEKEVLNALNNPALGTNSVLAGIHMAVLLWLLVMGLLSGLFSLVGIEVQLSRTHLAVIGVFACWIDHRVLHRNKRYIQYFKSFEKLPKAKRIKFAWLSFFVVISVWAIGIPGFLLFGGIRMLPDQWALAPVISW